MKSKTIIIGIINVKVNLNPTLCIINPATVGVTIPTNIIIAKKVLLAAFLSSGLNVLLIDITERGYVKPCGIPNSRRAATKSRRVEGRTEIKISPNVVIPIAKDIKCQSFSAGIIERYSLAKKEVTKNAENIAVIVE